MARLTMTICLICLVGAAILFLRPDPWSSVEEKAVSDATLLNELSSSPDRIGWRLTEDLSLKRAMLWGPNAKRRYPAPNSFIPLLYEFSEDETRRLTAIQSQITAPIWEQFDTSGSELLHCRTIPKICVVYDRLELEEMLGLRQGALSEPQRGLDLRVFLVGLAVILAGISVWLARGSAKEPDEFSLLPDRHSAMRGDLEIPLSARDLKILSLLDARSGAVVTKDELYDVGWGREFMPNSRALDQHMINLRRKLNPNKSLPVLIETVHGVGYRLVQ